MSTETIANEQEWNNRQESISPSKQQILDAAQKLLALHGYAGLSMRELAAASGLAKATIYHHFQDKDEIFRQVLQQDMHTVHAQLVAAANSAHDSEAQIRAIIRTYFQLMRARRAIIMNVLRELSQQESMLCDFINEQRHHYFAPIRNALQAGIDEGIFRPVNVEHTAISIVGMIHAFIVFHPLNIKERDTEERNIEEPSTEEVDALLVEQSIELFLQGIVTR